MRKLIIVVGVIITLMASLFLFIDNKKIKHPLVFAHRGASGHAPEHTLTAYEKAIEMNADYIEIDLRMTKDGHLVAIHDETPKRNTGLTKPVNEYTLKELKEADAGSWFGELFAEEKILTLSEIFEHFKGNVKYYIETRLINNQTAMEEKLVEIINEYRYIKPKNVIIQSFSDESLKKVKELNSRIPLVQLTLLNSKEDLTNEKIKAWKEYASAIGVNEKSLDQDVLSRIKGFGLEVHAWTVNEKERMRQLLDMGVDGIFTDYPDYFQEIIRS